jgi:hypothetical protein
MDTSGACPRLARRRDKDSASRASSSLTCPHLDDFQSKGESLIDLRSETRVKQEGPAGRWLTLQQTSKLVLWAATRSFDGREDLITDRTVKAVLYVCSSHKSRLALSQLCHLPRTFAVAESSVVAFFDPVRGKTVSWSSRFAIECHRIFGPITFCGPDIDMISTRWWCTRVCVIRNCVARP